MLSMKRYVMVFAFILFCKIITIPMAYGQESTKGVVVGNDVNVRQEAAMESAVIYTLKLGEYVNILDNKGEWFKIEFSDQQIGWIFNDLVVPVESKNNLVKKGVVRTNNLNVRERPDINAPILQTLQDGTEVTIVEENSNWYRITINGENKGWVHSDFIKIKPYYSTAQITGSDVNVRIDPSLNAKVIARLDKNSYVSIKDFRDNWYNIITSENQEGWVYKDYVKIVLNKEKKYPAISRSASRTTELSKIIDFAKQYLGVPYKWAGNGPKSFDCSGFTAFVYKHFGMKLPRKSVDQAKTGEKVSKGNLRTGDLVFFDTSGKNDGEITHVGIFIGDGEFIHASSGKNAKRVVISSLSEGYYNDRFVTARRIF